MTDMKHHCVICGKDVPRDRDYTDTCSDPCYEARLAQQPVKQWRPHPDDILNLRRMMGLNVVNFARLLKVPPADLKEMEEGTREISRDFYDHAFSVVEDSIDENDGPGLPPMEPDEPPPDAARRRRSVVRARRRRR